MKKYISWNPLRTRMGGEVVKMTMDGRNGVF